MKAFKLKTHFVLLAALGGFLAAMSGRAQQLVANGGFETNGFNGWTLSGNTSQNSVVPTAGFVHSGFFGAKVGPATTLGILSQNLATTAGQNYVLSLWLNNPNQGTPNEFVVAWNGNIIFDQANLGAIAWTNLVFTNLATSGSTLMELRYRNDPQYFGIDDVSVTPVGPPPPPPLPPPGNDNLANALSITTPFYQIATTNVGATRENNEPDNGAPFTDSGGNFGDPGGEGDTSVWWSLVAPTNGYMDITVSPATFTPLIAVYQGTTFNNMFEVAGSSEAWGVPGQLQDFLANNAHFNVLAGTNYRIAVDGFAQASGAFTFTSQFTAAPTNDSFASRMVLPANFTTVISSNGGATLETGEPAPSGNSPGASVWFSWTPTQTQTVTLTTAGSTFDTVMNIYTGNALKTLKFFAVNDNPYFFFSNTNGPPFDPLARFAFTAQAGTNYEICILGANGATGGLVLNNAPVVIDDIVSSQTASLPDGSVEFTNVLDLANMRANTTGPLRVSLWAQPGYGYQNHVGTDYQFVTSLNVPPQEIGLTNRPLPGTLGPTGTAQLTVSGICPPPFYYTNAPSFGSAEIFGVGYTVLATLEEQTNGVWQTRDSRMVLVGNWPVIGDFQGQNGGVVTLAAAQESTAPTPTFLQVNFGPPAATRLGGMWRFSPTNDGAMGEFRFYTNFFAPTNLTLLVRSTNFSVEMASLPGFDVATNSTLSFSPGTIVPLNLYYSVVAPRLVFDRMKGLGMTGTVGTAYRIETAGKLTNGVAWTAVTNNLLAAGTNWVTNTSLSTVTNRFYRAVWLPN